MRISDRRADARAVVALGAPTSAPRTFSTAMVAGLPEPARRYFSYAIDPGTPLRFMADIEISGDLGFGRRDRPDYWNMRGREILRPDGFVWRVRAEGADVWMSGSDGYVRGRAWTRFWLCDLLPAARVDGGDDLARSAAGRVVAESLLWIPAALLPSERVKWEAVDADTARARVTLDGHEHQLDLTVAADGRPRKAVIMRWSRDNREKAWRLQPFGGTIRAMREVDGCRVAAEVEGGYWPGTADYFPFYRARVTSIRLR